MKPEPNYFYVNRSLLQSDRWLSEPFTRGQAWVDLIGLAQHKKGFFRIRGIRIDLERGQLAYSKVSLSKRWKWSRNKVTRYINELEKDQNVIQQTKHQNIDLTTVITICNYDMWQGDCDINEAPNETPNDTPERHQKDTKRNTYNNDNNDNNNSINRITQKSGFGNIRVNYILEKFKELYGFEPIDKYARARAQNLSLGIVKFYREDLNIIIDSEEVFNEKVQKYFLWVKSQDSLAGVKSMDAIYRNFKMFRQKVINQKRNKI